jgi:hypothetical protein
VGDDGGAKERSGASPVWALSGGARRNVVSSEGVARNKSGTEKVRLKLINRSVTKSSAILCMCLSLHLFTSFRRTLCMYPYVSPLNSATFPSKSHVAQQLTDTELLLKRAQLQLLPASAQCHSFGIMSDYMDHAEDSPFFNDTLLSCVLSPNIHSSFAFPLLSPLVQPPLPNLCGSRKPRFHPQYNS